MVSKDFGGSSEFRSKAVAGFGELLSRSTSLPRTGLLHCDGEREPSPGLLLSGGARFGVNEEILELLDDRTLRACTSSSVIPNEYPVALLKDEF